MLWWMLLPVIAIGWMAAEFIAPSRSAVKEARDGIPKGQRTSTSISFGTPILLALLVFGLAIPLDDAFPGAASLVLWIHVALIVYSTVTVGISATTIWQLDRRNSN